MQEFPAALTDSAFPDQWFKFWERLSQLFAGLD